MRHVIVDVPVRAPAAFTLAFLPIYFEKRGHGVDFHTRVPAIAVASDGGRRLAREPVTIAFRSVQDPAGSRTSEISWEAKGTTAFPPFAGHFEATLATPQTCRLSLVGDYSAPGGTLGRAFDAVVGRRIARASIVGFLREIAASVEDDFTIRMAM